MVARTVRTEVGQRKKNGLIGGMEKEMFVNNNISEAIPLSAHGEAMSLSAHTEAIIFSPHNDQPR